MSSGDRDWMITGVSLRSSAVREALSAQDYLYTLSELGPADESGCLIGSIREVLVAPENPRLVAEALGRADTRLVTVTVTERGYHLGRDGQLDLETVRTTTGTIYHHLAAGLAIRRKAHLPGVSIVSCDNLVGNGRSLRRAMSVWLDEVDPELLRWFEDECSCPSTMVDRIVPATSRDDIVRTSERLGMEDLAVVVTEPFRQWVLESDFAGPRPSWEKVGAKFVSNVDPFEAAKLRMLNGAHSALAYLGLPAGHRFVHEAVVDPAIRPIVERLVRVEAAGSLSPAAEQDLSAYADDTFTRFESRALPHRLAQIAMDGSQKIGPRWLSSMEANRRNERRCPATLKAVAAWLTHVRDGGTTCKDQQADAIRREWQTGGAGGVVRSLFGQRGEYRTLWQPSDSALAELILMTEKMTA